MSAQKTGNIGNMFRWLKFNLVGVAGMAVQLVGLALLNRWMRGHYLWASPAAIELTLLHNFLWHRRFTWRDRRGSSTWTGQLARFHLSNGLVSLAGNLVLMRLLVQGVHLPLLVGNGLAILCCSAANFWLGNRWAFAGHLQTKLFNSKKAWLSCVHSQSSSLCRAFASAQLEPNHPIKRRHLRSVPHPILLHRLMRRFYSGLITPSRRPYRCITARQVTRIDTTQVHFAGRAPVCHPLQ